MGIVVLVAYSAHGATDTFRVQTVIDADVTPPSIPQDLTATPVASTQIDLAWDASIDDVLLSGYQVFRDNVQIATTTLTNYSDVGLTPNTTYTYYVTAFDSSFNVSASSTEVSTTTLASPPPAPDGGGGGGERIELQVPPLELTQLEVIPGTHTVLIKYETVGYVRAVIRWGETTSYELGSLAERAFARTHETVITGLTPDTLYWFTIEGENHIGTQGVLTVDTFRTLPTTDVYPPANVENLTAWREGDDVILSWDNPDDPDFRNVRILRSDLFYPSDTADGWLVYEDSGETARDRGAAVPNTIQYYTVFTYDHNNNISSGAVVAIRITDSGAEVVDPGEIIDEELNPLNLLFTDIEFLQDERVLPVRDGEVAVDGSKNLTVRIAYELLPEHLKTILVTLTDSRDSEKVFSFLLRINTEKTHYTATLAPLGVPGVFPLRVAIFDFKTEQVGYTKGNVVSSIAYIPPEHTGGGFLAYILTLLFSMWGGLFLLFLLFLLALLLISRRLVAHKES
jgi:chitodextrinase